MHGHMNVKLVHLVGCIIKKFVTMHGHMNVKKFQISYERCDVPKYMLMKIQLFGI